jgi:hypothetical protein
VLIAIAVPPDPPTPPACGENCGAGPPLPPFPPLPIINELLINETPPGKGPLMVSAGVPVDDD